MGCFIKRKQTMMPRKVWPKRRKMMQKFTGWLHPAWKKQSGTVITWCIYNALFLMPASLRAKSVKYLKNAHCDYSHEFSKEFTKARLDLDKDFFVPWSPERNLYMSNATLRDRRNFKIPFMDPGKKQSGVPTPFWQNHPEREAFFKAFALDFTINVLFASRAALGYAMLKRALKALARGIGWAFFYSFFIWRRFIFPALRLAGGLVLLMLIIAFILSPLYWMGPGLSWALRRRFGIPIHVTWAHVFWDLCNGPGVVFLSTVFYLFTGFQPFRVRIYARSFKKGLSRVPFIQEVELQLAPIRLAWIKRTEPLWNLIYRCVGQPFYQFSKAQAHKLSKHKDKLLQAYKNTMFHDMIWPRQEAGSNASQLLIIGFKLLGTKPWSFLWRLGGFFLCYIAWEAKNVRRAIIVPALKLMHKAGQYLIWITAAALTIVVGLVTKPSETFWTIGTGFLMTSVACVEHVVAKLKIPTRAAKVSQQLASRILTVTLFRAFCLMRLAFRFFWDALWFAFVVATGIYLLIIISGVLTLHGLWNWSVIFGVPLWIAATHLWKRRGFAKTWRGLGKLATWKRFRHPGTFYTPFFARALNVTITLQFWWLKLQDNCASFASSAWSRLLGLSLGLCNPLKRWARRVTKISNNAALRCQRIVMGQASHIALITQYWMTLWRVVCKGLISTTILFVKLFRVMAITIGAPLHLIYKLVRLLVLGCKAAIPCPRRFIILVKKVLVHPESETFCFKTFTDSITSLLCATLKPAINIFFKAGVIALVFVSAPIKAVDSVLCLITAFYLCIERFFLKKMLNCTQARRFETYYWSNGSPVGWLLACTGWVVLFLANQVWVFWLKGVGDFCTLLLAAMCAASRKAANLALWGVATWFKAWWSVLVLCAYILRRFPILVLTASYNLLCQALGALLTKRGGFSVIGLLLTGAVFAIGDLWFGLPTGTGSVLDRQEIVSYIVTVWSTGGQLALNLAHHLIVSGLFLCWRLSLGVLFVLAAASAILLSTGAVYWSVVLALKLFCQAAALFYKHCITFWNTRQKPKPFSEVFVELQYVLPKPMRPILFSWSKEVLVTNAIIVGFCSIILTCGLAVQSLQMSGILLHLAQHITAVLIYVLTVVCLAVLILTFFWSLSTLVGAVGRVSFRALFLVSSWALYLPYIGASILWKRCSSMRECCCRSWLWRISTYSLTRIGTEAKRAKALLFRKVKTGLRSSFNAFTLFLALFFTLSGWRFGKRLFVHLTILLKARTPEQVARCRSTLVGFKERAALVVVTAAAYVLVHSKSFYRTVFSPLYFGRTSENLLRGAVDEVKDKLRRVTGRHMWLRLLLVWIKVKYSIIDRPIQIKDCCFNLREIGRSAINFAATHGHPLALLLHICSGQKLLLNALTKATAFYGYVFVLLPVEVLAQGLVMLGWAWDQLRNLAIDFYYTSSRGSQEDPNELVCKFRPFWQLVWNHILLVVGALLTLQGVLLWTLLMGCRFTCYYFFWMFAAAFQAGLKLIALLFGGVQSTLHSFASGLQNVLPTTKQWLRTLSDNVQKAWALTAIFVQDQIYLVWYDKVRPQVRLANYYFHVFQKPYLFKLGEAWKSFLQNFGNVFKQQVWESWREPVCIFGYQISILSLKKTYSRTGVGLMDKLLTAILGIPTVVGFRKLFLFTSKVRLAGSYVTKRLFDASAELVPGNTYIRSLPTMVCLQILRFVVKRLERLSRRLTSYMAGPLEREAGHETLYQQNPPTLVDSAKEQVEQDLPGKIIAAHRFGSLIFGSTVVCLVFSFSSICLSKVSLALVQYTPTKDGGSVLWQDCFSLSQNICGYIALLFISGSFIIASGLVLFNLLIRFHYYISAYGFIWRARRSSQLHILDSIARLWVLITRRGYFRGSVRVLLYRLHTTTRAFLTAQRYILKLKTLLKKTRLSRSVHKSATSLVRLSNHLIVRRSQAAKRLSYLIFASAGAPNLFLRVLRKGSNSISELYVFLDGWLETQVQALMPKKLKPKVKIDPQSVWPDSYKHPKGARPTHLVPSGLWYKDMRKQLWSATKREGLVRIYRRIVVHLKTLPIHYCLPAVVETLFWVLLQLAFPFSWWRIIRRTVRWRLVNYIRRKFKHPNPPAWLRPWSRWWPVSSWAYNRDVFRIYMFWSYNPMHLTPVLPARFTAMKVYATFQLFCSWLPIRTVTRLARKLRVFFIRRFWRHVRSEVRRLFGTWFVPIYMLVSDYAIKYGLIFRPFEWFVRRRMYSYMYFRIFEYFLRWPFVKPTFQWSIFVLLIPRAANLAKETLRAAVLLLLIIARSWLSFLKTVIVSIKTLGTLVFRKLRGHNIFSRTLVLSSKPDPNIQTSVGTTLRNIFFKTPSLGRGLANYGLLSIALFGVLSIIKLMNWLLSGQISSPKPVPTFAKYASRQSNSETNRSRHLLRPSTAPLEHLLLESRAVFQRVECCKSSTESLRQTRGHLASTYAVLSLTQISYRFMQRLQDIQKQVYQGLALRCGSTVKRFTTGFIKTARIAWSIPRTPPVGPSTPQYKLVDTFFVPFLTFCLQELPITPPTVSLKNIGQSTYVSLMSTINRGCQQLVLWYATTCGKGVWKMIGMKIAYFWRCSVHPFLRTAALKVILISDCLTLSLAKQEHNLFKKADKYTHSNVKPFQSSLTKLHIWQTGRSLSLTRRLYFFLQSKLSGCVFWVLVTGGRVWSVVGGLLQQFVCRVFIVPPLLSKAFAPHMWKHFWLVMMIKAQKTFKLDTKVSAQWFRSFLPNTTFNPFVTAAHHIVNGLLRLPFYTTKILAGNILMVLLKKRLGTKLLMDLTRVGERGTEALSKVVLLTQSWDRQSSAYVRKVQFVTKRAIIQAVDKGRSAILAHFYKLWKAINNWLRIEVELTTLFDDFVVGKHNAPAPKRTLVPVHVRLILYLVWAWWYVPTLIIFAYSLVDYKGAEAHFKKHWRKALNELWAGVGHHIVNSETYTRFTAPRRYIYALETRKTRVQEQYLGKARLANINIVILRHVVSKLWKLDLGTTRFFLRPLIASYFEAVKNAIGHGVNGFFYHFANAVLGFLWLLCFRPIAMVAYYLLIHMLWGLLKRVATLPHFLVFLPFYVYIFVPIQAAITVYKRRDPRLWLLTASLLSFVSLAWFWFAIGADLYSEWNALDFFRSVLVPCSGLVVIVSPSLVEFGQVWQTYWMGVGFIVFYSWLTSRWTGHPIKMIIPAVIVWYFVHIHEYSSDDYDLVSYAYYLAELFDWKTTQTQYTDVVEQPLSYLSKLRGIPPGGPGISDELYSERALNPFFSMARYLPSLWIVVFVGLQFQCLVPWFVTHWEPDPEVYRRKKNTPFVEVWRPVYMFWLVVFVGYYFLHFIELASVHDLKFSYPVLDFPYDVGAYKVIYGPELRKYVEAQKYKYNLQVFQATSLETAIQDEWLSQVYPMPVSWSERIDNWFFHRAWLLRAYPDYWRARQGDALPNPLAMMEPLHVQPLVRENFYTTEGAKHAGASQVSPIHQFRKLQWYNAYHRTRKYCNIKRQIVGMLPRSMVVRMMEIGSQREILLRGDKFWCHKLDEFPDLSAENMSRVLLVQDLVAPRGRSDMWYRDNVAFARIKHPYREIRVPWFVSHAAYAQSNWDNLAGTRSDQGIYASPARSRLVGLGLHLEHLTTPLLYDNSTRHDSYLQHWKIRHTYYDLQRLPEPKWSPKWRIWWNSHHAWIQNMQRFGHVALGPEALYEDAWKADEYRDDEHEGLTDKDYMYSLQAFQLSPLIRPNKWEIRTRLSHLNWEYSVNSDLAPLMTHRVGVDDPWDFILNTSKIMWHREFTERHPARIKNDLIARVLYGEWEFKAGTPRKAWDALRNKAWPKVPAILWYETWLPPAWRWLWLPHKIQPGLSWGPTPNDLALRVGLLEEDVEASRPTKIQTGGKNRLLSMGAMREVESPWRAPLIVLSHMNYSKGYTFRKPFFAAALDAAQTQRTSQFTLFPQVEDTKGHMVGHTMSPGWEEWACNPREESSVTWWDAAHGGWETEAFDINVLAGEAAMFKYDSVPWHPRREAVQAITAASRQSSAGDLIKLLHYDTDHLLTLPYRKEYWRVWRWSELEPWEHLTKKKLGWKTFEYVRRWVPMIKFFYWMQTNAHFMWVEYVRVQIWEFIRLLYDLYSLFPSNYFRKWDEAVKNYQTPEAFSSLRSPNDAFMFEGWHEIGKFKGRIPHGASLRDWVTEWLERLDYFIGKIKERL